MAVKMRRGCARYSGTMRLRTADPLQQNVAKRIGRHQFHVCGTSARRQETTTNGQKLSGLAAGTATYGWRSACNPGGERRTTRVRLVNWRILHMSDHSNLRVLGDTPKAVSRRRLIQIGR